MKFIGTRDEIAQLILKLGEYTASCDGYVVRTSKDKQINVDDIKELIFPDKYRMTFEFVEEESGIQDEIEQEIDSLL